MAYSYPSDSELAANVASVSASLISKLANNNEGTAAGDPGAPRLYINAMTAPTAGNWIIREWRSDNGQSSIRFPANVHPYFSTRINRTGTYRTKIAVINAGSTGPTMQIYKNGVAFGTSRFVSANGSGSFTEDLSFNAGDLLQFTIQNLGTSHIIEFYIAVAVPLRPIAKSL